MNKNKSLVTRKSLIGLMVLCAVCIGSNQIMVWSPRFKEILSYFAYPLYILQNRYVDPVKNWWLYSSLTNQDYVVKIKAENEELRSQIARLLAEHDYARDTKELRDFSLRYQTDHALLAHIVVRHISDQMHSVILDIGATKGVQKNMVAVYKNHLLGRVVEVYPYYSKLLLITDRTCKVSAYCAMTKATGIHEGSNNLEASSLAHISHLAYIDKGDIVLSTGEGLIFPRGFALGRVTTYTKNDLFYEIAIQPLIDIRLINACYLIQKGNELMIHDTPSIEINRTDQEQFYTKNRSQSAGAKSR